MRRSAPVAKDGPDRIVVALHEVSRPARLARCAPVVIVDERLRARWHRLGGIAFAAGERVYGTDVEVVDIVRVGAERVWPRGGRLVIPCENERKIVGVKGDARKRVCQTRVVITPCWLGGDVYATATVGAVEVWHA